MRVVFVNGIISKGNKASWIVLGLIKHADSADEGGN